MEENGGGCRLATHTGKRHTRAMVVPCVQRVRLGLLASLLVLVSPWRGAAGTTNAWHARDWQSDDGLPNNTVSGLAQTSDGYLWLGTPSGLARFDGLRFEEFSPTNFIALPNRGTVIMLLGRAGGLWLAMDRGAVVSLRGEASRTYTDGLPNGLPYSLAEDRFGTLWVSYRDGTVYRIKDNHPEPVAAAEGYPAGESPCALAADAAGLVWFAKAGRVGMVSNGVFRTIHRLEPLPAQLTGSVGGGMWLCQGSHLFKHGVDGKLEDLGEFQPAGTGSGATALLEDGEGAVWIGTSFGGLFRYNGSAFENIETTHKEILCLARDREGNLWAGTQGGGLNRVRRRAITLEGLDSGLPFAAVQSICQDEAGTIWAATQSGLLVRRVGGRWVPPPPGANWPRDVTCLTADPAGGLWVGTRRRGLYRWREGQFRSWGDPSKLRGQTLHTMLVSRTGDLWLGEENRHCIQCLHEGQLSTFEIPPDSRVIRAMAEDAAGNIWAGTSKGVLFRISGGRLEEINPRPFRELASIRCLYGTPDGALWIGYAGWGVGRFRDGRYAEIRSEQGLHDDYISHVVEDNYGWMWFGSNRGIFKVRLAELGDVAEGRASRVRSISYGRGEGLPSLQATFGDSPGVLRSRDGRIWIPMRTALAVADPQKLRQEPPPPSALLQRVLVDEHPVAGYSGVLRTPDHDGLNLGVDDRRLWLQPRHRRVEFQFSAFSFGAPENIQFRYRLEGFDEEWVDAGTRRTAVYPRLPAGNYQFRVTACNPDGRWSSPSPALALGVTPFFYQTWWFRLATLALFTLGIVAVVRYVSFRRLHRQLRLLEAQAVLSKERARIAKDIHDDVGANLTHIALLGELARQDQAQSVKGSDRLEKISFAARDAIKSLDEIVWAVNPRNDTLAQLIDYAGQYALDFLRVAGVRCRLDLPAPAPPREVSTDVRHNVFLIVKEALNNVVKHARASTVWVRVKADEKGVRFEIEDDGRGFDRSPAGNGEDGLRNMRQRAVEIGGRCDIESRPGSGTRVIVELPGVTKE